MSDPKKMVNGNSAMVSDPKVLVNGNSTMASSRIVDLASTILASTTKFDKCLESQHLPSPSFDPSTLAMLPPSEELQKTQTVILEAVCELQALVLGPLAMLRHSALTVCWARHFLQKDF